MKSFLYFCRDFINNTENRIIMAKKNLIEEARRYVENAKKVLRENGCYNQELKLYEDEKYVRAAGHYLWHSVLLALDAAFNVRADRRTRVDVKDYLNAVGNRDRKLLALVNNSYNVMHLSMDYDGNQDKDVCNAAFRLANDIIDRCSRMLKE